MASPAQAVSQATYGHHGTVTILQRAGALAQILTDNDDTFWVRAEKLKALRVPKGHVALAALRPVPTFVGIDLASGPDTAVVVNVDPFITYLQEKGCTICLKTPSQFLQRLAAVYEKTTGAPLPEKHLGLSVVENGKPWSWSSEVFFRKPTDGTVMPSFAKISTKSRTKFGSYYISRNAFALELLALGFKLGRNKPRA